MINYAELDGVMVCICAPNSAKREVADLEGCLTAAGAIVLAPMREVSPLAQALLADLHKRKIDKAQLVVVANPGGYVGSATGSEIAHALRCGIPVEYLIDPPVIELADAEYTRLIASPKTTHVRPATSETADVADGALVAFTDGTGVRRAWCHVAYPRAFTDRNELAAWVEPDRVRPGMDVAVLLTHLDVNHPDQQDGAGFVAWDLEFLGEHDPHHEQLATLRRARPRSAAGAALLVRDPEGRILLVEAPPPLGGWRLPGALVEPDEFPRRTAGRGTARLLGVPLLAADLLGASMLPSNQLLVVDHLDEETDAETVTEYVFDGGTIAADHAQHIQAATSTTCRARFASPGEVPALVAPRLARRIDAALARLQDPAAPVLLERGFPPGQGPDFQWCEGDRLPDGLPVRQVSVWAFDVDGRVLLQHRGHGFALPGGRPEPADQSLFATGAREALEESQIVIDTDRAVIIGYQTTKQDPDFPEGLVQVRIAAPITAYLPTAPDTDPQLGGSRPAYRRYLVDIRRAGELLDFGPSGYLQADAAADAARDQLGLPVDIPSAAEYRDHGGQPEPGTPRADAIRPT